MKGHRIFSYFDKYLKKNLGGKGLSKFRLVQSYKEFASASFHSDHAMVLGNYMFLDVKDAMDLSRNGIFEPMSTKIIQNEIHESEIVVDIGANIGYYTLIMAKLVGGGGRVFSFEPETSNFKLLEKNVKINHFHNIILEQKAVANENGKLNLYLSDDPKFSSGMHRIFKSNIVKQIESPLKVDVIRLDDYFRDCKIIEKIRFIKIDVEGSTYNVLLGMKKIFEINKKFKILLEFSPEDILDAGTDPREVIDFLMIRGFKISFINEVEEKIEGVNNFDEIKELTNKFGLNMYLER